MVHTDKYFPNIVKPATKAHHLRDVGKVLRQESTNIHGKPQYRVSLLHRGGVPLLAVLRTPEFPVAAELSDATASVLLHMVLQ